MKTSKLISILVILGLILSIAACSKSTPSSSPAAGGRSVDPSGQTARFDVVMATGGSAATYYIMGAAFSQIAQSNGSRLRFTVSSTGASTENINLLAAKTVNFAIVQADSPFFAQLAEREFAGQKPFAELRSVYGGHSSMTHLTVRLDKGYNSPADLRGKTIAICPLGSPTGTFHRIYLAELGLEEGSYREVFMSYGEMGESLINDTVDAVMIFAPAPNQNVIEAAASTRLKIFSLTKEQQDSIVTKYPYISRCTIPGSAFEWIDGDLYTIGALAIIITTTDVPNDVVYDLCSLIGDNYEEVKASHSGAGHLWDLEDAFEGLAIEIHEGALQYYKDRGVMK